MVKKWTIVFVSLMMVYAGSGVEASEDETCRQYNKKVGRFVGRFIWQLCSDMCVRNSDNPARFAKVCRDDEKIGDVWTQCKDYIECMASPPESKPSSNAGLQTSSTTFLPSSLEEQDTSSGALCTENAKAEQTITILIVAVSVLAIFNALAIFSLLYKYRAKFCSIAHQFVTYNPVPQDSTAIGQPNGENPEIIIHDPTVEPHPPQVRDAQNENPRIGIQDEGRGLSSIGHTNGRAFEDESPPDRETPLSAELAPCDSNKTQVKMIEN